MAKIKKKIIIAKTTKKKSIKKVNIKKHTLKKVVKKSQIKKINKSKSFNWKSISIILGTIAILLILGFFFNSLNFSQNKNVEEKIVISQNATTLVIIEDPNCLTCRVDLFVEQIKTNLIFDLEVQKISIESTLGKEIINKLKIRQVPIFLFSEKINKRSDWKNQLKNVFTNITLYDINFYMLKPQRIKNKILIEEPQILDNAIIYGDANAPITIYEFSDFECPFCAIAEGNVELVNQFKVQNQNYIPPMPQIFSKYVETGKVKLVFYNMPLEQLHPQVRPVHLAALCANEQNKGYEFKELAFLNRTDWIGSNLNSKMKTYAKKLGLDQTKFDSCLDSKKYNEQINNEINYGISLGVSGTPGFFIGKNFLSGAQDFRTFQDIIEKQLTSLK